MPELRCLNCDQPFAAPARFCPHCGQRADTARLSFVDILKELMHAFTNVERSPLVFAWALITRPGVVAREYVEGKRRRHYGPFATLAVLVGLAALAVNLSGFHVLANDGLAHAPADLLQRHFNLLLLAQLPLLAACNALLFRSAQLTLPEHMVLVAYTLGVRAIVLAAVIAIAAAGTLTTPTPIQTASFWVIWYVYFGWAASQFYSGRRPAVWAKGIAAAVLGHMATLALLQLGAWLFAAIASR